MLRSAGVGGGGSATDATLVPAHPASDR
jgi:hypothetical protein